MFGAPLREPLDHVVGSGQVPVATEMLDRITGQLEAAKTALVKAQGYQKTAHDKHHKPLEFQVG